MGDPRTDPSVRGEPHLFPGAVPGERPPEPGSPPAPGPEPAGGPGPDTPDSSVWDEPALSQELAGEIPPEAPTYARWLEEARARTPAALSWLVTAALALAAGPWAILGAFLGFQGGETPFVVFAIVGPLTEEVLKVSAPLCVAERWPHLFRSGLQIRLCAVLSGLAFAAIENLLYLLVYVPDPPAWLVAWRWTACVALHTGCSLIAGLGVARMWRRAGSRRERPRPGLAAPAIVAAAIVHGLYNALAFIWNVGR